VLVAGALIGLGGPFWFDVYRQVASVLQVARGIGFGKSKGANTETDTEKARPDMPKPPEKAHAPPSAVDAFRDAVDADAVLARAGGGGRLLLASDGTPLK
jgi:hypothetical protein